MSTRLDLSKLSLMDALDLAKLIELEAHHRYRMFASQLGRRDGYDPREGLLCGHGARRRRCDALVTGTSC
ncbi:MAG: hypothetical protein OEM39_06460 [Acidimicrobiia bacterium]|nr:hypothetical protein [Acidimicrobiia bacterium]